MPVRRAALVCAVVGTVSCTGERAAPDPDDEGEIISRHVRFLAGDALEGRGTGSTGFQRAARYVVEHFVAAGLEPLGESGTFYQPVRFRRTRPIASGSSFVVGQGRNAVTLAWGVDFAARGDVARTTFTANAPVVFVGHGISDPASGHDDYAMDVRGAIVAFLPGAPATLPASRKDYYTSMKWRIARARGAVATIELATPEDEQSWPWTQRMGWAEDGGGSALFPGGEPVGDLLPRVLLSGPGTARLLALASTTIADVVRSPRPFRIADGTLTIASRHDEVASPHVIGRLRGSDPALQREHVVFVAHLDGLGRAEPVNGDDIYNGAIDNGLGSAMLLRLAQQFARQSPRSRRSVVFMATTGEELGIAGSPYFVERPTIPLSSIVAVVNIDGPSLLTSPLRTVLAMGAENSTLGVQVESAARGLGVTVNRAAVPLDFSDHYPFVLRGIPALWIVQDGGSGTPSEATRDAQARIHTPRDDLQRPFVWEAAATLTRLHLRVGQSVADADERPRWNDGDVLGESLGRREPPGALERQAIDR